MIFQPMIGYLYSIFLNEDKTYFGLANGQSFYGQCLPSSSLTVGYSSASLHWLSLKPVIYPIIVFILMVKKMKFNYLKVKLAMIMNGF